ncbi:hypothetical protein [Bacteroides nordii]|jgi:hypothetical protein|uniref:hypothetical protein n=1 Tax=Bacteroides nordii TaxID=291645 RepID=UPI002067F955|nr:hypothetical protein [Bacteroides nordii]DAZ20147.1 MAG TPA: type 2 lantibiotic biosynthesis protein LanM [Caudoviricetes sp.]
MKKNWISLLALTLSTIACIITWLRVEVYTTNDTFVGIMAGFMGACATILVGVQIYNSIETKSRLQKIEKLQSKLSIDIEQIKIEREKGERLTKYGVNFSIGLSHGTSDPYFAFNAYFGALKDALYINESIYIENTISNMEFVCNIISKKKHKPSENFDIKKYSKTNLEKFRSYPLIRKRYEAIFDIVNSSIQ